MKELYNYQSTIFLENGIINFKCENAQVDYIYLNDCILKRHALFNNATYPLLADITDLVYIDKSAQARLMWHDAFEGLNAVAVLIANNVQFVICQYVLMKLKLRIPVKVFRKKANAIAWIESFS